MIAFPLKEGRAVRIRRFIMLATIDLQDQSASMRSEISEIGAKWHLTAEFRGWQPFAK